MRALLMHSNRSHSQLQRGEVEPDRAKNKGGRVKGTFSRTGAPWMSCIRVCTFSPAGSFRLQLKSCLFLNPGGQHTAGQANPGCPASGFVPTVLQAALSFQGSPAYLNPGGGNPPKSVSPYDSRSHYFSGIPREPFNKEAISCLVDLIELAGQPGARRKASDEGTCATFGRPPPTHLFIFVIKSRSYS